MLLLDSAIYWHHFVFTLSVQALKERFDTENELVWDKVRGFRFYKFLKTKQLALLLFRMTVFLWSLWQLQLTSEHPTTLFPSRANLM